MPYVLETHALKQRFDKKLAEMQNIDSSIGLLTKNKLLDHIGIFIV